MRLLLGLAYILLLAAACDHSPDLGHAHAQTGASPESTSAALAKTPAEMLGTHRTFQSYWYQGLAELSRYELSQARYGETHKGEAILVFVTEDFRTDRHVKYEGGSRENVEGVLKLNAYRRFYTGIYPYTVLTSAFTPVKLPVAPSFKVSTSVSEWCGHSYAQLEREPDGLRLDSHSYFQGEEDRQGRLPGARMEDGLWTTLRRDPSALPQGELPLVPALHALRFAHRPVDPYSARVTHDAVSDARFGNGTLGRYHIEYPDLGRTLTIYYEQAFPHGIAGWEEKSKSEGHDQVTTAVRTHALMTDYWNHHGADDGAFREALGLEY